MDHLDEAHDTVLKPTRPSNTKDNKPHYFLTVHFLHKKNDVKLKTVIIF